MSKAGKKLAGITHDEASEIVLGLMLRGKANARAGKPEMFTWPSSKVVALMKKGTTKQERLRAECGNGAIDAALASTEHIRYDVNWLDILERRHTDAVLVSALREEADKVEKGADPDSRRIHAALMGSNVDYQRGHRLDQIPNDDVPFVPTGLPWLDEHLGGFPQQGLIIVTAPPKAGKTSLGIQFAGAFAESKRASAIYSLEMTEREIARRAREICIPKKVQKYVTVVTDLYSVDDITHHIAREQWVRANNGEPPLELAVVDFMDMMIEDETTESATAKIYKDLSKTAKIEGLPIVLFAQPNRSYVGGIVRPNHTRYSGMAEAMGSVLMSEYNPNTDFTGDLGDELPAVRSMAYVCLWACRGGFRKHPDDAPGAVQLAWDGALSWGKRAECWRRLSSMEPAMMGRKRRER